MLISDDHRFLFVHIPKTAGSSVTQVLAPHARQPMDHWMNRLVARCGLRSNLLTTHRHRWFRRHTPAYRLRQLLPTQVYREYFKFAFVRNPWDWLVSYYHFVLEREHHRRYRQIRALGSFEAFVSYECGRGKFLQSPFITDSRGQLIVDFVGRFECLQDDFNLICRKLRLNVSLVCRNRSQHRDYRDYYNRQTRALVAEGYREDIQRFGYTFDGIVRREVA
jgi:hypothetical protein